MKNKQFGYEDALIISAYSNRHPSACMRFIESKEASAMWELSRINAKYSLIELANKR